MPGKLQEAVQSVLGKFDSATDTFLEVAVADALRPLPTEIPPSNQVDRDPAKSLNTFHSALETQAGHSI